MGPKITKNYDINTRPIGYESLLSEPIFNPSLHLALEWPAQVVCLSEFGYTNDEIADCPSDFAVTNIFRILSEEGVACLCEVAKQLEAFTTSNPRIERYTRGGVYLSLIHISEPTRRS